MHLDLTDAPVLVARGLERTYQTSARATAALRGVDLDVRAGEWVAVVGPSGCGKSTLLYLLGGLDRPDAGTVTMDGAPLSELSETGRSMLRRTRIGYVFQFFNLIADLTVGDNVELPMLLVGTRRSQARRRRDELLAALGLPDVARALPSELSGGQQQRVAVARALANDPGVLLADEPTGNLDTEAARGVIELLRVRHAAGQTIVMVTHDANVAAAADRIVGMQDGAIVDDHSSHDPVSSLLPTHDRP